MARAGKRTIFVCRQCGKESPKWLGRYPGCQEWNSFIEKVVTAAVPSIAQASPPQELSQVSIPPEERLLIPMAEFKPGAGLGSSAGLAGAYRW